MTELIRADLAHFDVGPMVRLVSALRQEALTATSVERFAQAVSERLHETFRDDRGIPQTALVRFYATTTLADLPPSEQEYIARRHDGELTGTSTCLALLGTAGSQPAWNARTRSADHLVLPLLDAAQVATMPMIAALLHQLGIDVDALTAGQPEVMLKSGDGTCRIFYVSDARHSPLVPAQGFVQEHGIRSAIGFGGALPTGEVFAAVMFCTVDVPLPSAELFETVALSVSLAALDMLPLPVFEDEPRQRLDLDALVLLEARAELSHALLRAHEHATLAQADQAQAALESARYEASRATALASVALSLSGVRAVAEVTAVLVNEGLPVLGADGVSVALVDLSGEFVDVSISDGFGPHVAKTYGRLPLDDALPTTLTARTGQVVILENVQGTPHDFPEFLAVAADVGVEAVVSLPLWVGDRLIGALTCTWSSAHEFDDSGLELVHALAAQAAQAIDRARLLERERSHSEALQRSLLTDPPQPDHCEIVVRYVPAAEIVQVGGDWYDSFLQQDGATVIVIGDVVGHDTAAAAAMGQVRGLLRDIGWHGGDGPAELLSCVDRAMVGLAVQTIASCVIGRIEQSEAEESSGVRRLRWSNAGHPPPMVIGRDGATQVLGDLDADLVLGVDEHTSRLESQVTLDPGATVLLYTDGLIERRGQSLEEGLSRLQGLLEELADLPLQELCDQVLERLLPGADDDVALLAVRLHDQDRPRPVEAGPERIPDGL